MILVTIFIAMLVLLIVNFPIAVICFLAWKFIILAIFPTLPVFTFWQMYSIMFVLSFIGSFFKRGGSHGS